MTLKFYEKEHLADNVWAFRFQPSEPLVWTAGQYIRVEFPYEHPETEGIKRWFTVSSAPYEGIIQITTRVTPGPFKQTLAKMKKGEELKVLEKPHGGFVWQDSGLPIVFVAGGIGVTPYYSILKQRFHDNKLLNVTLVYGGRNQSLPFKDELEKWTEQDPNFKIHYIIGAPLTADGLSGLLPNLNKSLVYVSGPEPMVEALGKNLVANGLPTEQFKTDEFPNYTEKNY